MDKLKLNGKPLTPAICELHYQAEMNISDCPVKLYNHGFEMGEQVEYGGKMFTVIAETPNYIRVLDGQNHVHEIWSKHYVTRFNKGGE